MSAWTCNGCGKWLVMNDYEVQIHNSAFPSHRAREHVRLPMTTAQGQAFEAAFGGFVGTSSTEHQAGAAPSSEERGG